MEAKSTLIIVNILNKQKWIHRGVTISDFSADNKAEAEGEEGAEGAEGESADEFAEEKSKTCWSASDREVHRTT